MPRVQESDNYAQNQRRQILLSAVQRTVPSVQEWQAHLYSVTCVGLDQQTTEKLKFEFEPDSSDVTLGDIIFEPEFDED